MLEFFLQPAARLLDPSARVFVPFLLTSGLIAAATLLVRGVASRAVVTALFDRRLWWHRSARVDYQLIVARAAVRALCFGALTLSSVAVAALFAGWLRRHLGDSPLAGSVSALVAGSLFTLLAFLVEDWSRFALHRAMHRVPWLWAFHEVHHSAEVMTPFTLYRTHPVEALLSDVRGTLAIGLSTGLCAWAFGPQLRAWEVLGVDAIGFVWTLCGANLRHSHVWVSYGPRWERLLMSPAQHQVHHSRAERHLDRNYGTVLSLWDWLAGTLYVTREREALRFGVRGQPARSPGVIALLAQPFAVALAPARAAPARVAALLVAAVLLVGCSDSKFDRGALLVAMGENTLSVYTRFQADTRTLQAAAQALADAPGEPHRATARTAWQAVMASWQQAEMLRFGPLGPLDTPGGQAMRDAIYAWPELSRCAIEEELVAQGYQGGVAALANDRRGLGAVEYLLFASDGGNACDAASPINTSGAWAALSGDELLRRKAAYALAAATDLAARADALVGAWQGSAGFLEELRQAGKGSTLLPTVKLAFDTVAAGLFYSDLVVKDRKLAIPLGLKDCVAPCTRALESEWAGLGKAHLRANLLGLQLLLVGGAAPASPLGFDDQLEAAGAGPLAVQLRAALTAALAAVDALPDAPLADTLASQPALLQTVYERVKAITDFLKMEFTTALQISAPKRGGGDAD